MKKGKAHSEMQWADSVAIVDPGQDETVEVMLSPWGTVKCTNGDFVFDEESGALVQEAFAAGGKPLPIDYEHTTLGGEYATPSGAAPASGWIMAITAKPNVGLFAEVKWTEKAREMIRSDEYRYLSPVVRIRKKDSKVVAVSSAALTNKPAILDMMRVAAKDADDGAGVDEMDLKVLRAALAAAGITLADNADDASVLTATVAFMESAVKSKAEPSPLIAVAAKLGLEKDATVETIAAKVTELQVGKVDASEYNALKSRLETIEVAAKAREAQELVAHGIETAKLNPNNEAQMKWARETAKSDVVAFKAFLDAAPTLYTPGKLVTANKAIDGGDERTLVLTASASEYDENQSRLVGVRKDAFVNVALREKGLATLTPDEIKNMKGGN
jgi:phage I-like protein